jgi:hypothetical protein
MTELSVQVPAGFSVVLGNLSEFEDASLSEASSARISDLHQGEDLATFEHLVLDGIVCLDARSEMFVVSVLRGAEGAEVLRHELATFGAAVRDLVETLRGVWGLRLPLREPDTRYDSNDADSTARGWTVAGGWTILVDHLSTQTRSDDHTRREPMELLFAGNSGYRSIALYRIPSAGAEPYVGLLWAEPVGHLYERVFFADISGVTAWLNRRLRQDALPRASR